HSDGKSCSRKTSGADVRRGGALVLPSPTASGCVLGPQLVGGSHPGRWLARACVALYRQTERNADLLFRSERLKDAIWFRFVSGTCPGNRVPPGSNAALPSLARRLPGSTPPPVMASRPRPAHPFP